ncbi:MAG TPA: CHRD domain-containing protein [Pseudonocardiaceae bacterium]|nr:CHRD domain-containing protein [Pseudonocardiaceae bacterium]
MRHSGGIRKAGRVGASLAFASSILVFAGPAASAQEITTAYPGHDGHGQFLVRLSGDELQDGGDRDGRGVVGLDFDAEHERVCYYATWDRLEGEVTAFHLHHAPRHEDGGHWIDFFNDQHFDGDHDTVVNCVHGSRGQIYEVLDHPDEFYLNLHTTAHTMGAIRGQLD